MTWTKDDDERVREFCRTADVGKLTACPKCGMGNGGASEMTLSHFCTHGYCPIREWSRASDPNLAALDAWKRDGGPRPHTRPDGWPTRADVQWFSPAELAIREAMGAVEAAGGSPALTEAITLLSQARARVADHVESAP